MSKSQEIINLARQVFNIAYNNNLPKVPRPTLYATQKEFNKNLHEFLKTSNTYYLTYLPHMRRPIDEENYVTYIKNTLKIV